MTAHHFEYRVRPDSPTNSRFFELSGILDSSKAVERLAEDLRNETVRHLVLDFSHVTYVNSTGFGVLIVLVNELREGGREIYITDPHPRVRVVFEQLGGDELPVFRSGDARAKIVASGAVSPPPPPIGS